MNNNKIMEELRTQNPEAGLIHAICKLYERSRCDQICEWVDKHPDHWHVLCNMKANELSKEYMIEVAESIKSSHIMELQMIWLWKCKDYLDCFGNYENLDNDNP